MSLLQLCFLTLFLGVATVHSATTPIVLQDEETPIVLQDDMDSIVIQGNAQLTSEELFKRVRARHFERNNPTHTSLGEELVDGDIVLTVEQRKLLADRKAVPNLTSRWPKNTAGNPLVPYMFNDTQVNQTIVQAAIAHWQQHTCIRFTPATNFSAPHLKFYNGGGCSSNLGMLTQAGQYVSLNNPGCNYLGTAAHEIGHAIGFFHEQSRSDRDNYVVINSANVIPSYLSNFNLAADNNYSVPYDYSSDMHYGDYYFTNNGYPTIATKNFFAQTLIGQRNGLTHRDKLLANRMYSCITGWLTACGLTADPCLNDGYTGASCTCVCPPGTTGTKCETISGGYYDALVSTCSQNVTTAGNITSPNYPGVYPAETRCMKVITAPSPCYTIQLKFNSFLLYGQDPYCNNNMCCYFDSLEIRTSNPYNGTVYCGSMIAANQIFTSTTGQMLLYFSTETNYYSGWSAAVSFIYNSSCTLPTIPPTTTTVGPTTTTTKPTTTTTIPAVPAGCSLTQLSTGVIQWLSPGFGVQNYTNSYKCGLNLSCSAPQWMTVQLNTFKLENKTGTVCNDFVTLAQFFNLPNITYCGTQSLSFNISSCNLYGTFLSNNAINAQGFNISFIPRTSTCHKKILTGAAGTTGTFAVPTGTSKTWQQTGCEWWLESPAGTKITMQFVSGSLSGNCTKTSIVYDGTGARGYPAATSKRFCGTALPVAVTSTANKFNLMYYSTVLNSPLSLKYTIVAATG